MKEKLKVRDVWVRGGLATVITTIGNVALALLLAALVGASRDFLALQPGPVATATAVTMLAGTAVFAILNRILARPLRVFTWVAGFVAALSLIAPIALSVDSSGTMAGTTPAAALALIPLHLIPALALVAAFSWHSKEARP